MNAVAFFDAQFFGTGEYGNTFGTGGCDKQYGEFIDGQGYLIFGYVDALQWRVTHTNIGDGFAAHFYFVTEFDVGSHLTQDVDNADTGGVDAHMSQCDIGAWHNRCCNHKKGGRRDVGGHIDAGGG